MFANSSTGQIEIEPNLIPIIQSKSSAKKLKNRKMRLKPLWNPRYFIAALTTMAVLFTLYSYLTNIEPDKPKKEPYIVSTTKSEKLYNQYAGLMPRILSPDEEKFTIVMETYKRQDLYRTVVENYCNISKVHEVLLLWNNLDHNEYPLPDSKSFRCKAPVRVLPQQVNEVQNRLLQGSKIQTDAIFQVDDDFIIDPDDVSLGFNQWRLYRDQIISFAARYHSYNHRQGRYEYLMRPKSKVSIGIGAAMFIHKNYYNLYASNHPLMEKLRTYVVQHKCCDDIAMNFIVASQSRKGPIYLRVKTHTLRTEESGGHQGKSTQSHWKDKRSLAVEAFINFFGYDPLVYSDIVVTRLENIPQDWRILYDAGTKNLMEITDK